MVIDKTHPLGVKTVSLSSWRAWMELWNSSPHVEVRLGLLHIGWEVPISSESRWNSALKDYLPSDDPVERLLFYLAIADGWSDHRNFQNPGRDWSQNEPGVRTPLSKLPYDYQRQRLATKAFAVLFSGPLVTIDKKRAENDYEYRQRTPYWHNLDAAEVIAILRFFLRGKRGRFSRGWQLRNLGNRYDGVEEVRGRLRAKVKEFLVELLTFLWKEFKPRQWHPHIPHRERPLDSDKALQKRADAFNAGEHAFGKSLAKHQSLLARLLLELDASDVLMTLPITERTRKSLARLALRGEVYRAVFSGGQLKYHVESRVNSLEEALAEAKGIHSAAAKVLLLKNLIGTGEDRKKRADQKARSRYNVHKRKQAAAAKERRKQEKIKAAKKLLADAGED